MSSRVNSITRVLVTCLTISCAGLGAWKVNEGFSAKPIIPTKGDVPTIGHGNTFYEDGTRVKLSDPPITRERAEQLARAVLSQKEKQFAATLPGVKLTQGEFDLYLDFVGQYGVGNWQKSSMRKHLLQEQYAQACDALLAYRFAAGYDCSTKINGKPNKRCWGVWTRQQQRHAKCIAEQGD